MQPFDFLLVRKAQVITEIKALGILYSAIVAGLLFLLLLFFYKSQDDIQGVLWSGVLLLLLIIAIHVSRSDHRFIILVTKVPFIIYAIEYGTALIPFILLSWISFGSPLLLIILIPTSIISLWKISPGRTVQTNFIHHVVPRTNFEWKAGARKTGFMLMALWICALSVSWLPYAPVVAMWFFLLVVSSFYDEGEPREMVEAYQSGAVSFLKNKILSQLGIFLTWASPVMVVSLLFFPDRWWVLLFFLTFSCLNIAVFIVSKYAVWRPSETNRSQVIPNALCLLGLFLPFLLPLPLFILIRNYNRAIHNLKPYLDDFNQ